MYPRQFLPRRAGRGRRKRQERKVNRLAIRSELKSRVTKKFHMRQRSEETPLEGGWLTFMATPSGLCRRHMTPRARRTKQPQSPHNQTIRPRIIGSCTEICNSSRCSVAILMILSDTYQLRYLLSPTGTESSLTSQSRCTCLNPRGLSTKMESLRLL